MTIDFAGTTALVTGASSGLGVEFARRLAARGSDLVLVARRADRLETLATDLRARHGVLVTVLPTDLGRPGAAAALHAEVQSRGIAVTTLINNAGFGTHNAFEDEDAARISEEVTLNVAALTELTRAFYPELTAAGTGALVNVASTAAFQPIPLMAVYGATKAYVLSLTEALWFEARPSGLRVLALCPGATKTEFFDVAGENARIGGFQTPEQVVDVAMKSLDRRNGGPSVISGSRNRFTAWSERFAPRRTVVSMSGSLSARPAKD